MTDKNAAAEALIRWHFEVDPALEVVYRAIGANEDDPNEPIKLLEVSPESVTTRDFVAFGFSPTEDIPFRTVIAEVTPDGLARFEREGKLPPAWSLTQAKRYLRQAA